MLDIGKTLQGHSELGRYWLAGGFELGDCMFRSTMGSSSFAVDREVTSACQTDRRVS
jgi:hypothetical protein